MTTKPSDENGEQRSWLRRLPPPFYMSLAFFCLARAATAPIPSTPAMLWFFGGFVLLRFWWLGDQVERGTRRVRDLEAVLLTHDILEEARRLSLVRGSRLAVKRRRSTSNDQFSLLNE